MGGLRSWGLSHCSFKHFYPLVWEGNCLPGSLSHQVLETGSWFLPGLGTFFVRFSSVHRTKWSSQRGVHTCVRVRVRVCACISCSSGLGGGQTRAGRAPSIYWHRKPRGLVGAGRADPPARLFQGGGPAERGGGETKPQLRGSPLGVSPWMELAAAGMPSTLNMREDVYQQERGSQQPPLLRLSLLLRPKFSSGRGD